ncbi:MAG: hypothetical protein M1817_005758 [Caeruleum heppii]|nr:MAG: hypothetical protein M1817_005758 [Caeruleum heppii]
MSSILSTVTVVLCGLSLATAQMATAASPLAITSGSPTSDPNAMPCSSILSVVESCSSASAGFYSTVQDEAQALTTAAACVCYSGGSFAPAAFDEAMTRCSSYAMTSPAPFASTLGGDFDPSGIPSIIGFCSSIGDVRTAPAANAAATTAVRTGEVSSPAATSNVSSPGVAVFTGAGDAKDRPLRIGTSVRLPGT